MTNPDKINDYKVTKGPEGLATTGRARVSALRRPPADSGRRGIPLSRLPADHRLFRKFVRIADPAQAHRGSDDDHFCMFLTAQPIDEVNCIIRLGMAINFGPELTEEDILRRQDAVFAQDRASSRPSIPSASRSTSRRSCTCARTGWRSNIAAGSRSSGSPTGPTGIDGASPRKENLELRGEAGGSLHQQPRAPTRRQTALARHRAFVPDGDIAAIGLAQRRRNRLPAPGQHAEHRRVAVLVPSVARPGPARVT